MLPNRLDECKPILWTGLKNPAKRAKPKIRDTLQPLEERVEGTLSQHRGLTLDRNGFATHAHLNCNRRDLSSLHCLVKSKGLQVAKENEFSKQSFNRAYAKALQANRSRWNSQGQQKQDLQSDRFRPHFCRQCWNPRTPSSFLRD